MSYIPQDGCAQHKHKITNDFSVQHLLFYHGKAFGFSPFINKFTKKKNPLCIHDYAAELDSAIH